MLSTDSRSVEVACGIFEFLAQENGESVERSRIRRSVEFSQTAWPDDTGEQWWQWVVDAGHSLGLRCKVIDCTLDQLQRVVRDGGKILVRGSGAEPLMAVTSYRAGRFHVFCPLSAYPSNWLTRKQFLEFLHPEHQKHVYRTVLIEPPLMELPHGEEGRPATPMQRLLELLRPEALDLGIVVLFSLVTGLLALATPLAVEALVNTVAFGRFVQPIIVLALILFGFLLFSGTIQALQAYAAEVLQRRLFARMAAHFTYLLPRVDYALWEKEHPRELLNRFLDVITIQKVLTHFLMDGVGLILNTMIGMAILAFYHPWLLGFDFLLILMIAFVVFVLGRGAIQTSIKESKVKYRMVAWLQDLAAAPLAFRNDAAPEFALERTDRLIYDYITCRRKHFRILLRQIIFILGLQALASTVLLGIGGWLVIDGQLTLGQLVAAELIVTMIIGSFTKLDKHIESFYDIMAAVDKLGILTDLPIENQHGSLEPIPLGPASLVIENLTFDRGSSPISLSVEAGSHVALLTSSIAGRTPLLDVLYGLHSPSSGVVRINGVDTLSMRSDVLRRQVALVRGQELFSGTVEEQVHLERPQISAGDVSRVLREIGLLDGLLALEKGLASPVQPNGFPLVPEQISRLMLARGIVSRPQLLLVDGTLDSFSDAEAAGLIQCLTDPAQPWTLVLVTAREGLAKKLPQSITVDL
jgi:ABC-type bacteriocin/lantibiotic exporter with double-glycine peptidase domain